MTVAKSSSKLTRCSRPNRIAEPVPCPGWTIRISSRLTRTSRVGGPGRFNTMKMAILVSAEIADDTLALKKPAASPGLLFQTGKPGQRHLACDRRKHRFAEPDSPFPSPAPSAGTPPTAFGAHPCYHQDWSVTRLTNPARRL